MTKHSITRVFGTLLAFVALGWLHAAQNTDDENKDEKKPPVREREKEKSKEKAKKPPSKKGEDKAETPAPRQSDFKSGPQTGEQIPGSFAPFNINGKRKDSYHCLVCDYAVEPVVLVFAREPAEGKDAELADLLKQLDETVARHEKDFLHGIVVFLTPDAPSAKTGEDADALVKEAAARTALNQRMQARAEKVKNIVLAYFPTEGPKEYKINEKAEVTVLFYRGLKVEANFTFGPGELQPENVKGIIGTIARKLGPSSKGRAKSG